MPNLNHPKYRAKTLHRMKRECGWAKGCLSDEPRQISKIWLDSVFGQQQNELSIWLRSKLLICTDQRFFFGDAAKCKMYKLNRDGYAEVRAALLGRKVTPANLSPSAPNQAHAIDVFDQNLVHYWVSHAYEKELASKTFVYEQKSCARLWHPLQNLRSASKSYIWTREGLIHNYDIKACAPTLITQYAQQHGLDEYLFGIKDFLRDTKAFRQHIADTANITVKDAKALLNALFCGAKLGANAEFALFGLLGYDRQKVRALAADVRLKALRDDIKKCWKAIEPSLTRIKNAQGRKLPLNSRRKWNLYFDLERKVLDIINKELIRTGNQCFLEHDGFRTCQPIDMPAVLSLVHYHLGFKIEISHES